MQVHQLKGMSAGDVYDETQCNDEIKDGDIIVTDDAVVILVEAWPVLVKGNHGDAFHSFNEGVSWEKVDEGKYAEAYRQAVAIEL